MCGIGRKSGLTPFSTKNETHRLYDMMRQCWSECASTWHQTPKARIHQPQPGLQIEQSTQPKISYVSRQTKRQPTASRGLLLLINSASYKMSTTFTD